MLKSAAGKVMWVGKATVFLVGLALILAVTIGLASSALAHTNVDEKLFHLGHSNFASTISTLTKSGVGPALSLEVGSGPPLAVNSSAKVAKLNADKLDGKDSTAFASAGDAPLWAVVNDNGSLVRGSGVTTSVRHSTGWYKVFFNKDVTGCAYSATLVHPGAFEIGTVVVTNNPTLDPTDPKVLHVGTYDDAWNFANRPFHLIVTC